MTSYVEKNLQLHITNQQWKGQIWRKTRTEFGNRLRTCSTGLLTFETARIEQILLNHCKIFAKAHPRAKVSQTNINRLKAARKISKQWPCCFLVTVRWQLIRAKPEPSPIFFWCSTFLWWFIQVSLQQTMLHHEVISQLALPSALMYTRLLHRALCSTLGSQQTWCSTALTENQLQLKISRNSKHCGFVSPQWAKMPSAWIQHHVNLCWRNITEVYI